MHQATIPYRAPKGTVEYKDRYCDCSFRSRLGKPTQAVDANLSVFNQMTDDEQKTMLATLEALKDASRSERNFMPDCIGTQTAESDPKRCGSSAGMRK